jgi:hypothetical protein
MKKSIYFLSFVVAIMWSCSKSDDKTAPTPSIQTFTVQVNTGVGSGSYKATDTVFVFANPTTSTQVFDKWTGDVASLASPNEWRTTLKMPASNVNITATYKTIAPITFTNVTINGSQVYYYVPTNYKGIILPFHGAGGNASGWITNLENLEFCKYAASNGYALVITESKDRVNKRWDATGVGSVDIANIDVILNSLQTSNVIAVGKPLYGIGMSQGSGFCSLITYVKNYKAGALYCVPGISSVFDVSTVPIIWNMARKDVTEEPNRLIDSKANFDKLQARSIPSVYYINEPTPLYASRFTIIPEIDLAGSTSIYNGLKNAGYLDAKGFFNTDPRLSSAWFSAIPAPYNSSAYTGDIDDQMYVCFTQHKLYKDSNFRTIEFFNRF